MSGFRPRFCLFGSSLCPAVRSHKIIACKAGKSAFPVSIMRPKPRFVKSRLSISIHFGKEWIKMASSGITQQRAGAQVKVLQADLAEPLDFAEDASFDVVVCVLVLHYLRDWLPALKEFQRVLRPGGLLIFSTHHPFTDMELSPTGDYFSVDLIEDEWDVGKVQFYRRPLSKISRDLFHAGFVIEEISEPQPQKPPDEVTPAWYERTMKNPWRLLVRARR